MQRFSIIPANLSKDQKAIICILMRNLPQISEKRFQWLYLENPVSPATCLLVQNDRSKEIVGCASLFPRMMKVKGKEMLAGIAGDFAINKEMRGYLGIRLQRELIAYSKREFDFLYGFPNKLSESVQLKSGYKNVGKITRIAKLLKANQKLKGKYNPFIAKIVSPPINHFLKHFSPERKMKGETKFREEYPSFFDHRFDELWERVCGKFQIIGCRNSNYLNWKYTQNPGIKYKTFSLTDNEKRNILGYVVYYIQDKICFIVDLLSIRGPEIWDSLLGHFLLYLRKIKKANSVSSIFLGKQKTLKDFRNFRFYERAEEHSFIVYFDRSSSLSQEFIDPEKWYIFEGDRDI